MKLHQFNNYIYYTSYEDKRDRPSLGYIKGESFSVAIDAGHSKEHVDEFYALLKENNLPLPTLTIITHWHWDHSFGMHAINGLSIANFKTNEYLQDFINKQNTEFEKEFLKLDKSIELEYQNQKVIVKKSDLEFNDSLKIDLINDELYLYKIPSPHTDDSTIAYLKKAQVVFIGDAASGVFPTWIQDPKLAKEMAMFMESLPIKFSIGGHWDIENKEQLLDSLKN